jgi:signal transduction histidine kinase
MPRNTAVFGPTFTGQGIVRSDDIRKDPRYGKNAPYYGMPKGHLPVVSYLAVPVLSRSGEVIGGLFFGHSKPGRFNEREERIVEGLASQAAIAMDNARLYEQAKKAIQARDEFLSIASHELKTPLTPLRLQVQNLKRQMRGDSTVALSPEKLGKVAGILEKQLGRLTALVEDLLDVSRISAGRLSLNFEEVDLSTLVSEVAERYRPQLQEAGCELKMHLAHSIQGKLDHLRMEQVLINLLTNAAKYAPGTPVEVLLERKGGLAVIQIKD